MGSRKDFVLRHSAPRKPDEAGPLLMMSVRAKPGWAASPATPQPAISLRR
jgi:hypothetical protein